MTPDITALHAGYNAADNNCWQATIRALRNVIPLALDLETAAAMPAFLCAHMAEHADVTEMAQSLAATAALEPVKTDSAAAVFGVALRPDGRATFAVCITGRWWGQGARGPCGIPHHRMMQSWGPPCRK